MVCVRCLCCVVDCRFVLRCLCVVLFRLFGLFELDCFVLSCFVCVGFVRRDVSVCVVMCCWFVLFDLFGLVWCYVWFGLVVVFFGFCLCCSVLFVLCDVLCVVCECVLVCLFCFSFFLCVCPLAW